MTTSDLLTVLLILLIVVAIIGYILYRLSRPQRTEKKPRRDLFGWWKDIPPQNRGLRVLALVLVRFGQLWFVLVVIALVTAVLISIIQFLGLRWDGLQVLGWIAFLVNPLGWMINLPIVGALLGVLPHMLIGCLFYGSGAFLQLQIERNDYLRAIAIQLKRSSIHSNEF